MTLYRCNHIKSNGGTNIVQVPLVNMTLKNRNTKGVVKIPQFRGPASCYSLITKKPGLHS